MYAYDAYLVQCAMQTNSPLLTLDLGLRAAAEKMSVQTLEA
ncbi:MAG: type II toxin-antitoxin system VapC family toxin [Gammaproteobacteria bacterium]|nr:type II toxin-antitoxin system VapC family toxin [Gammaproteobacteria bacterium]MYF13061.1 type II toxin-antitoxin system VapC family toxin [Gammaproteobacteria bacterium]MYG11230.1 type II toxin-antitoxin system VapC family toxin [Gammaproteobacteria bacterium]MYK29400.1 type II toxin-antitoxin system VapC family toxin [Gammaproteobacteria bacterium]MYK83749.1 type II toxin-antitoxin system VapC family toxin [Gammaproteobacteria bacterium]